MVGAAPAKCLWTHLRDVLRGLVLGGGNCHRKPKCIPGTPYHSRAAVIKYRRRRTSTRYTRAATTPNQHARSNSRVTTVLGAALERCAAAAFARPRGVSPPRVSSSNTVPRGDRRTS